MSARQDAAPARQGHAASDHDRRRAGTLSDRRAFVFDLDGCVWHGSVLSAGAAEVLARLHAAGRPVGFISNNSRATGGDLRRRLHALGVAFAEHVLTPLEIAGEVIAERWGLSRVLVMGATELADAIATAGHRIVRFPDYRDATVVVVGNDFELDFDRLTGAARAVAAGAPLVTPNLDPRLPIEDGDFLPGCGAIVEAVAVSGGARPFVIGKPNRPLFDLALKRLGVSAHNSVMIGDSVASDIRGGRDAGMLTVLYAPAGIGPGDAAEGEADLVVRSFHEIARLAGVG